PDAVWPFILTVQSMAIVPSSVFPKDKLQPSDKVIGSGQYTVASYEPGQQTVLEKNPNYSGPFPAKNDRAIVQYFDKPSALKLAIEQGDVDVAYRSFSPTDLKDLKSASGVNVVGGSGTEIRYLVFNLSLKTTEWNQYDQAALTNKYPQFQFGWFPDYPDADDYTQPFYAKTTFLNNGYSNPQQDKLIAQEEATTNDATRAKAFTQI